MAHQLQGDGFTVGFSDREITAWGGLFVSTTNCPDSHNEAINENFQDGR